MYHGEERNRQITVNYGNTVIQKREKYCALHGWIDVFSIGGDIAWQRQHGGCNRIKETGAEFQIMPKVMRKAA